MLGKWFSQSERVKTSTFRFHRPPSLDVLRASNLQQIVQALPLAEVVTAVQENQSARGTAGDLGHTTGFLTPKSAKKRELETLFLRGIFLTRASGLRISLTICSGTL